MITLKLKWIIVLGVVAIYAAIPAYRYYVLGSWVGYRILRDKPRNYRIVPKNSAMYKRVIGG